MNTLPQAEVRALLQTRGFVRAAVQADALLVTDVCLRMPREEQAKCISRCAQAGFRIWRNDQGLWAIDPDDARWQQLWDAWQDPADCGIPNVYALMDVYALARLLAAHPAPLVEQPKTMLRALLKSCDGKGTIATTAASDLQAFAEALRLHQPLPSAAAGLLFAWLLEHRKGENHK